MSGELWKPDHETRRNCDSEALCRRAGWFKFRIGSSRFLGKAAKDPDGKHHAVEIRKLEDAPTKRKLARETIEAFPFGYDFIVAVDYVKYGLAHLHLQHDVGKCVLRAKVEARNAKEALRKGIDTLIRRGSH